MREGLACRCGRGTLYDVLQVSPWCEPEVIQAAFRALARTRHPDVNRDPDAEDQMRRLNVAYQTLSDPARRARYDEELALEAVRPVAATRPSPSPSAGPIHTPAWTAPSAAQNGHSPNGSSANGYGPRYAGAGSRPGASRTAPAGPTVAAADPPLYETTVFDTRSEVLFPRSAIYASLIIMSAIVALIAWLVLDTLAQRPSTPPTRLPRGYEEMRSGPMVASAWQIGQLAGSVESSEPGLSPSDERWKQ